MSHIRAVVWSVLLVSSLLAGGVLLASPVAADDGIEIEHTLAQSTERGELDVTSRLSIPSETASLTVEIPDDADVYETDGFTQTGENRYEWTESTNEPSLQYDYEVNVTIDRGQGERYIYVDTGEWAIVRTPVFNVEYSGMETDVTQRSTVNGDGAAGPHITYLGSHEESVETAADQQFRVVVPTDADTHEDTSDVVETFEFAAERLDIGPRDPEVFVVVAPSSVEWAATGVQRGDADMWIRDVEAIDSAANTWVHEYAHTRQEYEWTAETEWTLEGMAEYYAALLTYERGDIGFGEFEARLERGTDTEFDDVVLAEPGTWADNEGDYQKGALVYGYLDYQLRLEADASIDGIIAEIGADEMTQEVFLDAVENAGGSELRAEAERYTETTDTPEMWSREEHAEAFGDAPNGAEPPTSTATETPADDSVSSPDDESGTSTPVDGTPTATPTVTDSPTTDEETTDEPMTDEPATDGSQTPTIGDGVGFGVASAVVGVLVATLLARRRRP